MKVIDFKGKKITVMGLGLHGGGASTVRFLSEAGARIIVTDMKSKEELAPSLEKLKGLRDITYVFSQHRPEDFSKTDMVVKNPAAPWSNKYIQLAIRNKILVESDASLFFKLCRNKIIGVTGTKGKTTTASLITHILKISGADVLKVGIGQVSVLDKLKSLKKDTLVVFELSSWRLSSLGRFGLSPQIAVVTNLYPDHLNYYKSMTDYAADKEFICSNQKTEDICVLNSDDEKVSLFKNKTKASTILFSAHQELIQDKAVFVKDGMIYYRKKEEKKKLLDISELLIRGEHNQENVLATVAVALAMGIKAESIKKALRNFSGVEHRLELVREIGGVKYFNDTAATMPEATVFGLRSFSEPLILIAGGSDKNLDMNDLAREIVSNPQIRGVIFLKGLATEKLLLAIHKNLPDEEKSRIFLVVYSMEKAVELAAREAQKGDVVLLSPGAASFGLFQNEFDRGDKFRRVVLGLKNV